VFNAGSLGFERRCNQLQRGLRYHTSGHGTVHRIDVLPRLGLELGHLVFHLGRQLNLQLPGEIRAHRKVGSAATTAVVRAEMVLVLVATDR
jgi:hypothetical protein